MSKIMEETECPCGNCVIERKMDKLLNDLHEVVKKSGILDLDLRILSGIELALRIANDDFGVVEAAFNEIREQVGEIPAGVTLH